MNRCVGGVRSPNRRVNPAIVVFSSLFPSQTQPGAGLFIRERMFRVATTLPVTVVAPTPWFPMQGLLRRWRPHFRRGAPPYEKQSAVDVWYPRFLSFPGIFKGLDGWSMAVSAYMRMRKLKRAGRLDIIDAHFGYPDGYAATLLGRWLKVPVTITMRGTESRQAHDPVLSKRLEAALKSADRVFAVADALRKVALAIGVPTDKVEVVGNGIDAVRFYPQDKLSARARLGVAAGCPVLISVGGLVPRKGFHRVIDLMPALLKKFPDLVYLIVGGASAEGNILEQLEEQVNSLNLQQSVRFLGTRSPENLAEVLSAADVFVLATANEGWANVFLEAMACGLPVVTTDVGGNREVVSSDALGLVVAFGDAQALEGAICQALNQSWDRAAIRRYAEQNSWSERVERLCRAFVAIRAEYSDDKEAAL